MFAMKHGILLLQYSFASEVQADAKPRPSSILGQLG